MLVHSAEESFQAGMQCLMSGKKTEALARIEAAIQLELRFGESRPQARYLSFYGLLLALERRQVREGLRFCREAVTQESYNPDLRCNLGRVLLRAGRRKELASLQELLSDDEDEEERTDDIVLDEATRIMRDWLVPRFTQAEPG